MLEIKNYSKSFKENIVLENVNLKIGNGELFGIIGSNGAGKTTLLNSIMARLDYNGEIIIDGNSNFEYLKNKRNEILFMPDQIFVYDFLTGVEFIKFVLDFQKIQFNKVEDKVELLLKLLNLNEFSNQLIKTYSHGMKRKIALITLLVQSPKYLLLDEPVSGLDTTSILVLKKLFSALTKNGTTIIFTTHILDLVENLCDTLYVLNNNHGSQIEEVKKMNKSEIEQKYLNIIGSEISKSVDEFLKS